jgi:hypothetical protein
MARIHVTDVAKSRIREAVLSRRLPRPVLAVFWFQGLKHVSRNAEGETIWSTPEDPGWQAHLVDWSEMPKEMKPNDRLEEVDIWFAGREENNTRELTVDHVNGKYVVIERAI